jgi:hypothetical protein
MKCFERLVKDHITSTLPDILDPLQFAYRPNRSTDDAIAFALHTALSHLDKRNTYVRMLFNDYSSAFNTIVPSKLIIKFGALGLSNASQLQHPVSQEGQKDHQGQQPAEALAVHPAIIQKARSVQVHQTGTRD